MALTTSIKLLRFFTLIVTYRQHNTHGSSGRCKEYDVISVCYCTDEQMTYKTTDACVLQPTQDVIKTDKKQNRANNTALFNAVLN
jgi:hypothetical protein